MSGGPAPSWTIEPLDRHHDRDSFRCDKEPLDLYLKERARQDARRRAAAPFVATTTEAPNRIGGYYTLSAFAVAPGDLPDAIARKLPRYPLLPATLLGRLAVDHRQFGQGLGKLLLLDALVRAHSLSNQIAAAAVVVDAVDGEAWRFYRHFNFHPFPERNDRLFLSMAEITELL